jgi:hypothetical protein
MPFSGLKGESNEVADRKQIKTRKPDNMRLPADKKLNAEGKAAFLEEYAKDAAFYTAGKALGIHPTELERALEEDPEFELECRMVTKRRVEAMESEAFRRAVVGVDEPVYYKGMVVGHINRKSDAMLQMLLKAHDPKRYREGISEAAGAQGGVLLLAAPMSPDMWRAAAEQMRKQQMSLAIGSEKIIDQPSNEIVRG